MQWALKVREMYQDIEAPRRRAGRRGLGGGLAEHWQLFRELEPKQIVNDEQLFRELKDVRSLGQFGVYFFGGMGAEAIRELLKDLDLNADRLLRGRRSRPRRVRSSSARSSA